MAHEEWRRAKKESKIFIGYSILNKDLFISDSAVVEEVWERKQIFGGHLWVKSSLFRKSWTGEDRLELSKAIRVLNILRASASQLTTALKTGRPCIQSSSLLKLQSTPDLNSELPTRSSTKLLSDDAYFLPSPFFFPFFNLSSSIRILSLKMFLRDDGATRVGLMEREGKQERTLISSLVW